MKKFIIGLAMSVMASAGIAHAHVKHFTGVEFVNAYDGDTFTVNIPGVPDVFGRLISVRVRGVDAPEIRGRCTDERYLAMRARNWVREKMSNAKEIELTEPERGKYFRIVASVKVDGMDLGIALQERGYAVKYTGSGPRYNWCEIAQRND